MADGNDIPSTQKLASFLRDQPGGNRPQPARPRQPQMPMREASQIQLGVRNPQTNVIDWVPPGYGRFPVGHVTSFQSILTSAARVYRQYDEAVKNSLDNARFMRNDCGIMECLEARQRCVALLNWHLEPENDKDQVQKDLCVKLTAILKRIRRFTEYRRVLLEAIWFGKNAIQHQYGYENVGGEMRLMPKPRYIGQTGWAPIHGDKLCFRFDDGSLTEGQYDGQLGIRVGMTYAAGRFFQNNERWKIETTDRGPAYFLSEEDRRLVAVHKHMIEDGEYEDAISAGKIHGIGIRSRIYWEWVQKQETLAFLMEYLERCAGGIQLWKFPAGNLPAKNETEKAAQEYVGAGRNVMLVPVPMGDDAHQYGVEVIEPGMAGIDMLKDILSNYFGHRIKRYILGQVLTSEAESTGLGSGVADAHMDTLMQIVKYDATNLEETITFELLQWIKEWNFPEARNIHVRFVIDTESDDAKEKLEAWQIAYDMGCTLKAQQVMEQVGAAMPGPEDEVLSKQKQQENEAKLGMQQGMSGGMGSGGVHGIGMGGGKDQDKGPGQEGGGGFPPNDEDDGDQPQPPDPDRGGGSEQYARNTDLRESIQSAADATDRSPSDDQRSAGNYRKGKFRWNGLTIAIENPAGSIRSGKSKAGVEWSVEMQNHYGYILRHESEADGDHVDVFMGPHPESDLVCIVDQKRESGRFDEHKVMLGFTNIKDAEKGYLANYSDGWAGLGSITAMTVPQFLAWLDDGDTGNRVGDQVSRYSRDFKETDHPRDDDGRFVEKFHDLPQGDIQVVSIDESAGPRTRKEARIASKGIRGAYKNTHSGEVIHLTGEGIRHAIAMHDFDTRVLPSLPGIVENAVPFATESPRGENNTVRAVKFYYAPIKFDGELWLSKLTVKHLKDDFYKVDEMRFYNLNHKKNERFMSKAGLPAGAEDTGHDEPLHISIDQLRDAVKKKYPEHVKPGAEKYARTSRPAAKARLSSRFDSAFATRS